MSAPPDDLVLLFLYGTLKRGGINHAHMAGQMFVAAARTAPGFRLYELDGYPGMVPDPSDHLGVTGEIWAVDTPCLARLDRFEGVDEGLYRRVTVPLAPPHEFQRVQGYLFARSIVGRRPGGPAWP